MVSEFFPGLSQKFSKLLEDADDYNTVIKVGENPNTKEFHAHSSILRARSPYFDRALSKEWVTKNNNMINFKKPNISPNVFEMIIRKDTNARIPKDKQYNYNLLYRGSRDGYDINIMRSKCSGQGACVMIIKTKENGNIIGGYNPFVVNSNYAIYESNYQNLALNFGNSDLVVNGNAGTCNQAHYESKILDTNYFTIEEMEIFRFYQN
ncbi:14531_t:CDS:2 [Funneliformis geosporum]|nr:14531_t:CDS:2 [Funneliformis geosporum]